MCCILLYLSESTNAQVSDKVTPVIEGGKLIVELVKALSVKKDNVKEDGCKGSHADLCIRNQTLSGITVTFESRANGEKREIVIQPDGRECFLHAAIGIWTYDLKITGTMQSIRKGDVLIEGCNHLDMTIK